MEQCLFFSAHIYNMEIKLSHQSGASFYVYLPIVLPAQNLNLKPNYSKFALENDWISSISQNVQNLGCFLKKHLKFFKIGKDELFQSKTFSK